MNDFLLYPSPEGCPTLERGVARGVVLGKSGSLSMFSFLSTSGCLGDGEVLKE